MGGESVREERIGICPVCKRPFPIRFNSLQLLGNDFGKFLIEDAEVIQSGKNEECPYCGVILWIPIRGDPTFPFVLIGEFTKKRTRRKRDYASRTTRRLVEKKWGKAAFQGQSCSIANRSS